MAGDKQHFLPAALIGGFGVATDGQPLREARVQWRLRTWVDSRSTVASAIGYENRMYRLATPPPGVSADIVDEIWEAFEGDLPAAIARATAKQETPDDHAALLSYVAAAAVRHRDFTESVNRWRGEQGLASVTGDDVQFDRIRSLAQALPLVRDFRWKFVHAPATGPRFVLNDRGWSYIGEQDRPGRGLWIPLNGHVALLAWLQTGTSRGFEHLHLWPGWAAWLNAATWEEAPRFVVSHPDDSSLLDELTDAEATVPTLERIGPYRNTRQRLFGDFV